MNSQDYNEFYLSLDIANGLIYKRALQYDWHVYAYHSWLMKDIFR